MLETSGLSKPGPVLRQLASLAGFPMRVSVVATYDALRAPGHDRLRGGRGAMGRRPPHRRDQARRRAAGPPRRGRAEIAGLNPLADTIADPDRSATVAAALRAASRRGLDPALLAPDAAAPIPASQSGSPGPSAPSPTTTSRPGSTTSPAISASGSYASRGWWGSSKRTVRCWSRASARCSRARAPSAGPARRGRGAVRGGDRPRPGRGRTGRGRAKGLFRLAPRVPDSPFARAGAGMPRAEVVPG